MGIIVPPIPPLLTDGDWYLVRYDAFASDGCEDFIGHALDWIRGFDINRYYAAGGDCISGNPIEHPGIFDCTKVLAITQPS